ncbi:MAG: 16S rRNA (uracil(1498)-N(3))-methyltransferase [Chitinivibrionales bacterium]|nr:16S rRNA (uracil(1498)-N(3))-methyltransferase [Chitinivibrionales bacterium]
MNLLVLFEDDFIDTARVRISGSRARHALTAAGATAGNTIRTGILNGNTGTGRVVRIERETVELQVNLCDPPPPPLSCTLILALPRPKALRRILLCAATMGIKKIIIIGCRHVEKSYWSSPVLKEENLHHSLLLGLEQARDTIIPEIIVRRLFKPFIEDEAGDVAKGTTALAAHPGAQAPCPRACSGPVTLAIGPERGFIPYELGKLEEAGFSPVSLGKRVLRVEHAVPAILGRLF